MDYIPKERVFEGVGYVGVATTISMSLGPGFGVLVSQNISHSVAFFISSGLIALGVLFILMLPSRQNEKKATGKLSFRNLVDVKSLPLTFTMATISYCTGMTSSFLVLVGQERGIDQIALFFFVSALAMIISRPAIGRYTDAHGSKLIISVAILSEVICMSLLAFAPSISIVIVAAIFRAFGQGTGQAVLQGQVLKDAPDDARSRASATLYIGVDTGQGLGAVIGGIIAQYFGYGVAFLSVIPVLAIGTIPFIYWLRKRRA